MQPGNHTPVGGHDDRRSRAAAVLFLRLGGLAQIACGVAAVLGLRVLEDNVHEIESNPSYGRLYLSLVGWGVLLLLTGLGQLGAARSVRRKTENGRVLALGAALIGLGLAFFTLAFLHAATFVPLATCLAALYLLSYRVDEGGPAASGPAERT